MSKEVNSLPELISQAVLPSGVLLFSGPEEILSDPAILPYSQAMLRAWKHLNLSAILVVDGLPTLYLKEERKRIGPTKANRLQREFWNQGLATVLVLVDPYTVRVFSGMAYPVRDEIPDQCSSSLVETLDVTNAALGLQRIATQLATGQFYRRHAEFFNPERTVDAYLLGNLGDVRDALTKGEDGLPMSLAHALLGRVLFACYLIDRGIVKLSRYPFSGGANSLRELLDKVGVGEAKDLLYALFEDLRDQFNGSMFDKNLAREKRQIRKRHVDLIRRFLAGEEIKAGQATLGFWAYDFKWIPVETISAIYEDFLKKELDEGKRDQGAYYTPRFLAEMVVDLALEKIDKPLEARFMDPSCGSGIFLVTLFNRMVAIWDRENPNARYLTKVDALLAILKDRICGIDMNLTACRIACFSLYLSFLDHFSPRDIDDYTTRMDRKLPSVLLDSESDESVEFPVIYRDDFLDTISSIPIPDCLVGNPPWVGRGESSLEVRFMKRSQKLLGESGLCCWLLPSKVFLSSNLNDFQKRWLREVKVDKIVQLADYRKFLFSDARTPCVIVRYANYAPDLNRDKIEYITPKVGQDELRHGVIPVSQQDRKWIATSEAVRATEKGQGPVLWKQYLWGSYRDVKFLDLLSDMPKLEAVAGPPSSNKRWRKGQGFQPYYNQKAKFDEKYPKPKILPWSLDHPFVDARNASIDYWILASEFESLNDRLVKLGASTESLRRSPDKRLFEAPMVLISQGISDGFVRVAYSEVPVLFQDSLQSISGPKEDEDLLLFLTAYLKSSLAPYYLFHNSANWGTERDKVHLDELLSLPFPLPESGYARSNAKSIVRRVANRIRKYKTEIETLVQATEKECAKFALEPDAEDDRREELLSERRLKSNELKEELNPLIYEYFGLIDQEIVLVEDTVSVLVPSITPAKRSDVKVSQQSISDNDTATYQEGLRFYAECIAYTLNQWAKERGSSERVKVTGGVDQEHGLALVSLERCRREAAFKKVTFSEELARRFSELQELSIDRRGTLDYLKGMIVFEKREIHIAKPANVVNWTRTAALNDAAEIFGRIKESNNASK